MSLQNATAQMGMLPAHPPRFDTERFVVVPLQPAKARELLEVLLCDPLLAEQFALAGGQVRRRGAIRSAARQHAVRCRHGHHLGHRGAGARGLHRRGDRPPQPRGIDVEVLCASQFFGQGVADEAGEPAMAWLDDAMEVTLLPLDA